MNDTTKEVVSLNSINTISDIKSKKLDGERIANLYRVLYYEYKDTNPELAKYYKDKAEKLNSCFSYFALSTNTKNLKENYIHGFYCHSRFCPICIAKDKNMIFKLMCDIVSRPEAQNYSYFFMTLTIKNCPEDKLGETLDILTASWRSLISNKNCPLSKRYEGAFCVKECTYNKKTREYHPHIHALVMVDKDYFHDVNKYMTHDALMHIWRKALKVDYLPSVDIRGLYSTTQKSIAEIAKYNVKSSDIVNADVLETYDKCFKGRRLRSWTGKVKTLKKLVLEEWEKESKQLSFRQIKANPDFITSLYSWNYFKKSFELKDSSKGIDTGLLANEILDSFNIKELKKE